MRCHALRWGNVNQEVVSAGSISIVYKSAKGKEIREWVLKSVSPRGMPLFERIELKISYFLGCDGASSEKEGLYAKVRFKMVGFACFMGKFRRLCCAMPDS
ncbi:hypothetical protein E0H95_15510 [Pseudomonas syringae pv. tomato]|nr:hypothetical protein [Pseudomonas syringae pv. tomato]